MIKKGLFVLPRGSKTIKSYGYIKNICYQIISILDDIDSVNCVYYVGEESIVANMWASEISKAITGKPPIKIPKFLLFMVALLGELLKKMNLNFPFYLTRYKNMTEDYDVPIKKTITKFDLMYKDLNENINETIKWYKNEYEN